MFLWLLPNHNEKSLCRFLVHVNRMTANHVDTEFTDRETQDQNIEQVAQF